MMKLGVPFASAAMALAGLLAGISGATAQDQPRASAEAIGDAVPAAMKLFYEPYLGRKLTKAELRQLSLEFVRHHGAQTCEASCQRALKAIRTQTEPMRRTPGQPQDIVIRHAYLSSNFFNTDNRDTLHLRLLNEPDPARVADYKSRRLMTERDVQAAVSLEVFRRRGGAPKPRPMTRDEIDYAVKTFNRSVDHGNRRRIPMYLALAAELWSGLEREWPRLKNAERRAVRRTVHRRSLIPLKRRLLVRLIGVSEKEAKKLYAMEVNSRNATRRWRSRFGAISSAAVRAAGMAATTNVIVNAMTR